MILKGLTLNIFRNDSLLDETIEMRKNKKKNGNDGYDEVDDT